MRYSRGVMSTRRRGLIAARKVVGLSQQQLADRVGVNRVTLARWELGENDPSLAMALQLAQILGKRVEQLFGREPVFSPGDVDEARRLADTTGDIKSARAAGTAGRMTHGGTREQRKS